MQKRKDNKGRVLKDGESCRKDGLYMYRWFSKDGKRHCIYASELDKLRRREAEIARDLLDGVKTQESSKITVNDLFDVWKENKKGLKSSTRGNYIYMYEHYVQDGFGNRIISDIKRSDVRHFYNQLLDAGGFAVNSLEVVHNLLHQIFKIAVDDDYIRKNPSDEMMKEIKLARNYNRPKRHSLTIPEQKAFLKYIEDHNVYAHWLPLFKFFLGTGCRVSEVVGLRWQDVDLENKLIFINHGITYYQREERKSLFQISKDTKTEAGNRVIPMLDDVKDAILAEKKFQEDMGIVCSVTISGYSNFIFLNRFGNIHNPQTINRTIKRIVMSYNQEEMDLAEKESREPLLLPPFSCHNLRHTFATRYCENENNLKVIQEILGHRDIATTMDIYAEATKEAKVKSFENLNGKIFST